MRRLSLLALLAIFLITILSTPALAADITGERTLNTISLKAGESFRVTLNVTVLDGLLYAPGIDEDLPSGWTVKEVQNDGLVYQAANTQWVLVSEMESGTKIVIYDVFVPETTETGTYSISGKVSAKEWNDGEIITRKNNITGDTNVTIGLAGIHIYPGDDAVSILKNAPAGSTIYWHEGDYSPGGNVASATFAINDSLQIIGDGANRVNVTGIGLFESSGTTIEGICFINKAPQFYSNSYNNEIRNCRFESAAVQIQDDSLIENCTFTGTKYLVIWAGSGGGIVRNNLFEISGNLRPVYLKSGVTNVSISNNKFMSNHVNSEIIYVNSKNTLITDNIFNDVSTDDSVIGLSGSTNTTIKNNTFENCSVDQGVIEFQSGAQTVATYLNNFINCSLLSFGSGTNVSWSSPSEISYTYAGKDHVSMLGNYYDQYEGVDADGDGVGDASYAVGSGTDSAPLISPFENYANITEAVPQLPVASFTADIVSGSAPLSVNFTDQSTGKPMSWSWDFDNDGTVDSTEQSPTYIYTSAGTYTVNLTVSNSGGSDSEIKTDYIVVSTQETPDTAEPVIDSVVLFPANTTAGSTINVSVNATDDVEVTEVTAGDVRLIKTDDIWQGSITAPSAIGAYSLQIIAKDAAGNTAETSVPYRVVQLSGGANIVVSPRSSSVSAGNDVSLAIKVKNTQNIDDTFKIRISVGELPDSYQADLSWFNWTEKVVTLKTEEEVLIPVEVTVPDGTAAGRKLFRANVKSETSAITGFDTGYLVVA